MWNLTVNTGNYRAAQCQIVFEKLEVVAIGSIGPARLIMAINKTTEADTRLISHKNPSKNFYWQIESTPSDFLPLSYEIILTDQSSNRTVVMLNHSC